MENLTEKTEEFAQEENKAEDVQPTNTNEDVQPPNKDEDEDEKKANEHHKHHHHAHPHIVTIEHSTHGRSNTRSFGIDHEPGAGI